MKTQALYLTFENTNVCTYNIQGSQLDNVTTIQGKQLSIINDPDSVPPSVVCELKSDLISSEESFCSLVLVPELVQSFEISTKLHSQATSVRGYHNFMLFYPGVVDWTGINITVCLTLTFN